VAEAGNHYANRGQRHIVAAEVQYQRVQSGRLKAFDGGGQSSGGIARVQVRMRRGDAIGNQPGLGERGRGQEPGGQFFTALFAPRDRVPDLADFPHGLSRSGAPRPVGGTREERLRAGFVRGNRGNHRNSQVGGDVEQLDGAAHGGEGCHHGPQRLILQLFRWKRGAAQTVIPPDGHGIPFYQFHQAAQGGFFDGASQGAAVTVGKRNARFARLERIPHIAVSRRKPCRRSARNPLGLHPSNRRFGVKPDGHVLELRVGRVPSVPPGELPLAKVQNQVRRNSPWQVSETGLNDGFVATVNDAVTFQCFGQTTDFGLFGRRATAIGVPWPQEHPISEGRRRREKGRGRMIETSFGSGSDFHVPDNAGQRAAMNANAFRGAVPYPVAALPASANGMDGMHHAAAVGCHADEAIGNIGAGVARKVLGGQGCDHPEGGGLAGCNVPGAIRGIGQAGGPEPVPQTGHATEPARQQERAGDPVIRTRFDQQSSSIRRAKRRDTAIEKIPRQQNAQHPLGPQRESLRGETCGESQ